MAERKTKKTTCCRDCFDKYEHFFEFFFERIGVAISKYPLLILSLCIITNCGLMSGIIGLESENDVEVLYTPQNSQAFQDRAFLRTHYKDSTTENFFPYQLPDFGRYAEIIMLSKNRSSIQGNIFFKEITDIDGFIRKSMYVTDTNGSLKYFEDLCAVQFDKCSVFGDMILSKKFEHDFLLNNVSYPFYNGTLLSPFLASPKSTNGMLVSTIGFKLRYYLLQNSLLSAKWELDFLARIQHLKLNYTDISYTTSESLAAELEKNTNGDIQYFSITFTIMLTYASLACSSSFITCNNIGNRLMLGLAGVLAPILAIGSAVGFVSAIGVKFTSIVGVMPFLIVGIGIDDMFILMSGIAEAPALTTATIKDRMKFMLKKSGVAITITSITDLLAFTIGATSIFVSIRTFCIYTGVAVFFCYLNQLFFFCPAICLNEKRTQHKRHFLCCVQVNENDEKKRFKSKIYKYFFSGFIPRKRQDVESALERYPKSFVIRCFLKPKFGKFIILVMFIVYIGSSIYGTFYLKQGLSLYNLVSENSYFYKYSLWNERFYKTEPIIMLCVKEDYNYSLPSIQSIIKSTLENAKNDKSIDKRFEINWLDSYTNSTYYETTSEEKFVKGLRKFIESFAIFSNDIVFNKDFTHIQSSKFYVKSKNIETTDEQKALMLRLREISSKAGISCFFYTPAFIFYEQFVYVWPSTLQTVGVALGVMIFITVIFMPHPLMVLMVSITLVSVLVGIFGFMYFWGLTLSSITMIHLVMSVGFSVDFSVHICHAFLSLRCKTQTTALTMALDMVGGPILNAAFSSLLGIAMLGFSKSYIFKSFGKVMCLVIGFGLFHAAFVLPLLLWVLFPCYSIKQFKTTAYHPNSFQIKQVQISRCSPLIEAISNCLRLRHVSNCADKIKLNKIRIFSLPVTYPIADFSAYTFKDVCVFSTKDGEACYWDFVECL